MSKICDDSFHEQLSETHERVDNPFSEREWWLPKAPARRESDEQLKGFTVRAIKSFNAANMARVLNRLYNGHVVEQAPVILPLHVYGRLKRVCDEGQHCAPLPTGYPKCPCNCGGPFGDCLR